MKFNSVDQRCLLEQFFIAEEQRAFQVAQLAVNNREDALDIVQESMYKLVEKYSQRPEAEWRPLFNRILHSRINDYYRRNHVRNRLISWWSNIKNEEGDYHNVIEAAEDTHSPTPDRALASQQSGLDLQQALQQLPLRQRQAFILRAWEEYNVKETAKLMNCTAGSVKTHYSRALTKLKDLMVNHDEQETLD